MGAGASPPSSGTPPASSSTADTESVYEAQKQFVLAQLKRPEIGRFFDDSDGSEPDEEVEAMRANSRFV